MDGVEIHEVARLDDTFSPTGNLVATISDVGSVIDISWQEGSDYITITTDDMVQSLCIVIFTSFLSHCLRYFSIHWRHAILPPHVMSVLLHFLCVAGVQWRTSAHESLSVWTTLRQGDGYRSLTSVSPPRSLQTSSLKIHPPL